MKDDNESVKERRVEIVAKAIAHAVSLQSDSGTYPKWSDFRDEARAAIEAADATRPDTPPVPASEREAAWRDGWAECKARLTEDEAFCMTEDVEQDAWLDSATCEAIRALATPPVDQTGDTAHEAVEQVAAMWAAPSVDQERGTGE